MKNALVYVIFFFVSGFCSLIFAYSMANLLLFIVKPLIAKYVVMWFMSNAEMPKDINAFVKSKEYDQGFVLGACLALWIVGMISAFSLLFNRW